MADALRLYVGTSKGVFATRFKDGACETPTLSLTGAFPRAMAGAPGHPERVYAAAANDGLYRTTDAGRSWSRVFEGDVRAITIDPTNDDVVYVGTEPVHLYRSDDAGDTWHELGGILDLPEEVKKNWWFPNEPHLGHILQIFVHPDDPRLLYVSVEHGGIVRSSDGGATWEDVSQGIDYLDIHMVATAPHRFDRFFAATAQGFYATPDPAEGWQRSETGFTRDYFHDFVFFPPERHGEEPTMLISTADKSPGSWNRPEHARGAVFRSRDLGESWHWVGKGLPQEMPENVWAICRHPSNDDSALIGLGRHRSGPNDTPGAVFMTHDRGDSWERLNLEIPLVLSLVPARE
jgi:photosystem II stability/assembly factor-like uncharacterized protein